MREGFFIYTAYAKKFQRLTDAQFGRLVRALIEYQETGEEPEIDDLTVGTAFDVAKVELDAANTRYMEICEQRREAGLRGGRPKKANGFSEETKKANGFSENQTKANESKKSYKYNRNRNDKDIFTVNTVNINAGACEEEKPNEREIMLKQFNVFWDEYPKHEAKDAACRMWISLNPDSELSSAIIKAVRENKAKNSGWKRDGGRYIPRADKWLLDRRWLDEIREETEDPKPQKKNMFNDFEQRRYTKTDYDDLEARKLKQGLV